MTRLLRSFVYRYYLELNEIRSNYISEIKSISRQIQKLAMRVARLRDRKSVSAIPPIKYTCTVVALCVGAVLHPTWRFLHGRLACINLHKLIPMQTKRFDVELGYHRKPPWLTSRLKRASIRAHACRRMPFSRASCWCEYR